MKQAISFVHAFLLLLLTTASLSVGAAGEKLQRIELGATAQIHRFGNIYLASQPAQGDFALARKQGVTRVLNLRPTEENRDFDERELVTGAGLDYLHIPVGGPADLTDAVFESVRKELKGASQPLLLHCASGNRVGALWIPFRVLDGGLTVEQAVAEAKAIGLKSPELEKIARDYIAKQKPQHHHH